MNAIALLQPAQPSLGTIQYLVGLVMVLALLLASLASLLQCRSRWAIRWPRLGRLSDLLLSADPKQREYILRHLVGVANCLAGLAALNYGAARGVVDLEPARWLTAAALGATALFYAVIRSGLNRQTEDPSLVGWQTISASIFLAWGYYLGGPCKPVALILLLMMLMFCVFNTVPQILIRTSLVAGVAFGAVMLRIGLQERHLPNGPQIQMVYFAILIVTLLSTYLLAQRHANLRNLAAERKRELSDALARIQILATRDDLTGLYNRRHMLEQLNLERHRCIRTGRTFCIALLDIDHFKRVNDSHGHGVGDEVLSNVALAIAAGLRETDAVARWGGEEFLVMFTDTDCDTAQMVLNRILKSLSSLQVSSQHPLLRVSFSGGVTLFDSDELLTRTVDRADKALYQAKTSGRNRVMVGQVQQPPVNMMA